MTPLRSDSAVKQILLSLNETERFLVEDLDETHLIISTDHIERVKALLAAEVSQ